MVSQSAFRQSSVSAYSSNSAIHNSEQSPSRSSVSNTTRHNAAWASSGRPHNALTPISAVSLSRTPDRFALPQSTSKLISCKPTNSRSPASRFAPPPPTRHKTPADENRRRASHRFDGAGGTQSAFRIGRKMASVLARTSIRVVVLVLFMLRFLFIRVCNIRKELLPQIVPSSLGGYVFPKRTYTPRGRVSAIVTPGRSVSRATRASFDWSLGLAGGSGSNVPREISSSRSRLGKQNSSGGQTSNLSCNWLIGLPIFSSFALFTGSTGSTGSKLYPSRARRCACACNRRTVVFTSRTSLSSRHSRSTGRRDRGRFFGP